MSDKCSVKKPSYILGMLAPAMLVIVLLSFMTKRVRLKPDLWNGRPGLPIPVNFLGKERNRLIIVLAFGATASSFFEIFVKSFFADDNFDIVKTIPNTPYGKVVKSIIATAIYSIINIPYLACLNAEYRLIGYVMGLFYTFIRCTVELLLYLPVGCSSDSQADDDDIPTIISYIDFLLNLPSMVCTILLIGAYAIFLYQEIRKIYARNTHPTCMEIFLVNDESDESVAEDIDWTHVSLLLANKAHRRRVQVEHEPWYVNIRRKIYQTRPDFKFSTQFLSAVIVSFIIVYQLAVVSIVGCTAAQEALQKMKADPRYGTVIVYAIVLFDYCLAAILITSFIAVLQLLMFIKSHRSDVLKTYRTRVGQLPDEQSTKPKMLVGKSLRFCGYQIAFTGIGMVFIAISALFVLLPIFGLKILDARFGRQALLEQLKIKVLSVLPIIIAPLLIWFALLLLCTFVFRDRTYPDLTVTIDNRRLFDIMSYFFFFLNILVGVWSGLFRIVKGAALGLVFLCRLDRTSMMTGYRKWDRGYMAYIGFLNVLVAFRHPVMLCFCQVLIDERKKVYSGLATMNERPRVSTKALNQWFLAVFLIKNPSLLRYRKRDVFGSKNTHYSTAVDMSTVVLEEREMPIERLKSTHFY